MSRLKALAIQFNNNNDVFSPGDVIRGQITIQVDSTRDQEGLKNVQGIWVKFNGKAKTRWVTPERLYDDGVNHHPSSRDSTVAHSKKERFFETVSVIFGKGKHEHGSPNQLNVQPGTHAYPFSLQLPDRILPSAFEHKYGYVRYKVKATLSLIRKLSNKSFKTEKLFSVVGPTVDLNTMPEVQSEVKNTKELFDCCGCGSTVEESITVGLPKQGYVSGESLYVTGQVDNRDREESCDFNVKFIQKSTFYSKSHEKNVENIIGSARSRVETPRGRVTDFSLGLRPIPPVPPSGLPGCNIIDVEYYILCRSVHRKWKFPIVIGTVPLRAWILAGFPPAPPAYTPCSSVIDTALDCPVGMVASASACGGEAPPPSYVETVGQIDRRTNQSNNEGYFEDDQFVPRYPYFNLTVDAPPDSRESLEV